MAQIQSIRLPNGKVVSPGDWTDTPLYSTVEIGKGAQQTLQAFSYGIGGDIPGSVGPRKAQEHETNMRGPGGVLAETEHLLIFSIMLELGFWSVAGTDPAQFSAWVTSILGLQGYANIAAPTWPQVDPVTFYAFKAKVLTQLRVAGQSGKHQIRVMPNYLPAGMGVYQPLTQLDANGNPTITATNGSMDRGTNRQLATVHEVLPGEQVSVDFLFPEGQMLDNTAWGGAGVNDDLRLQVRTYLDGYRRRPVA